MVYREFSRGDGNWEATLVRRTFVDHTPFEQKKEFARQVLKDRQLSYAEVMPSRGKSGSPGSRSLRDAFRRRGKTTVLWKKKTWINLHYSQKHLLGTCI